MRMARRLLSVLPALAGLAACVTPGTVPRNDLAGQSAPAPAAVATSGLAPLAFDVSHPVYTTAALQSQYRPGRSTLEGSIWMQADNAESSMRTGGGIVRDKALNAYVRGLVCKLAGPYCGDIRTYIVRVPEFNATMMPNGVMQVWTGLLLRVRNEAQLATVLGHEIGHYLQRHSVKRMEDAYTKTNALVFVQLAGIAAGVPAAGDLAALATLSSIAAFSREHETEADDVGLRLLVQHGYDPREAATIWTNLLAESRADKNRSRGSIFFASHPPPEDRSERLTRMAAFAVPTMASLDTGWSRFLEAIAPHRASFITDELNMRRYDRLDVLLTQLATEGTNLGEVRFYQGELHRVRNEKGDDDKALKFYGDAIGEAGFPPAVYRSLGQVLRRTGRAEEAKTAFRRYLELAPGASDRGLVEMMLGPT